ncbi:unnamed protein product [Rotaria sp. Silwood1]|nr:unnamed protein product [Rotaria sp. Silwood1]CAF0959325.1 unnamed protein product [Rotaria sp. Silwood1]
MDHGGGTGNTNNKGTENPFIFSLSTETMDRARTYTLSNWPSITPSAQEMTYAGWWYTNIADRVICIHCDTMFHNWNDTDRPYEVHRLKSPQCFFVRSNEQKATNNQRQLPVPIPATNAVPNGQTIVGAVHAEYAAVFRRHQTFHNWPEAQQASLPSIETFVDAGFFYTGDSTVVRCFYCNGALRNWQASDDPKIEHARWFPQCAYIRQFIGENLYQAIQRKNRELRTQQNLQESNNGESSQYTPWTNDEIDRMVKARLDLPVVEKLRQEGYSMAIIRKVYEMQLRFKKDDFKSDVDLRVACLILDKQVKLINGNESNILIPQSWMKKYIEEQARSMIPRQSDTAQTPPVEKVEPPKIITTVTQRPRLMPKTEEPTLCLLCLNTERQVACLPCGHLTSCVACGHSLKTCPICRAAQSESTNCDIPTHVCCEEHRRQLLKFADLSQLLPNIDMTNLAFYFARQCQNNKKAARTARRLTAISQRSSTTEEKSTSPFHIVDRLLAAPTGIYGTELNSRPFHEICSRKELILSFERYIKALTLEDYNVIPYAFDVQLKYRSLSFLSKQQIYNRLMSMTRINLKETKINRVHKGSMILLHSIVDPFITPRSIQSIVEDANGNVIRLAIYNWYTILADQSMEHIRNRVKRERHFIVGNPFIKMAADGLLMLRVDNPRLEMWFTDYEKEIEQMDADKLRDLGNKCFHNNDINGAIEYYSLGLDKSPNDNRILSNRAECYLQSQLPHLALADCERIFAICKNNPAEDKTDITFTWKIHYRKLRALIGLQLYDEAKLSIHSLVECAQDVSSGYHEIIDRFRRILDSDIPRLENEANGNYDMFDLMTGRTRRSDEFCAEFERENVYEFRQCEKPEKGYGIFALCPLKPGTLLLVEQPFAFVHSKSNEELVDSQSHLVTFSLTQKREHRNIDEDGTSAGKYLRQSVLELLRQFETRILVDHKKFIEKLSHLTPLRQQPLRKKSDDEDYYLLPYKVLIELFERNVIGSGLWPKLARFNHSCLPNCFYIIINHLCFLSVLKPIETGEEMTICYLPSVYSSYIDRTLRLREYYIDECTCKLCDYDKNIGQAEMQQINRQFEESEEDEEKRRYLFKNLIYQYSADRPLGFVEQMSRLKRTVKMDIFIKQVIHGYLAYPYILNYILSHIHKYDKLQCVINELQKEFAYINWTVDNNDNQIKRFRDILQLFINFIQD